METFSLFLIFIKKYNIIYIENIKVIIIDYVKLEDVLALISDDDYLENQHVEDFDELTELDLARFTEVK